MRTTAIKAVKTGLAGTLLIGLLVWVGGQLAIADDAHIQIAVRDSQVQIGTDVSKPFYVQWRTPGSRDWANWAEGSLPEAGDACVWMRAIFEPDDETQWEIPADVSSVYYPAIPATTSTDGDSWVAIGGIGANGILSLIDPEDPILAILGDSPVVQISADYPTAARNNQAMATPCAGSAQLLWRNQPAGYVSRWDLADTTGTNFNIRYYDRMRTLPGMDPVSLDSNWTICCIAALDEDGTRNDMVWQNKTTGRFSLWRVNLDPTIETYGPIQYEITSGVWTNAIMANPWKVVGVAALDEDKLANDIIWHQPTLGIVSRWELGSDGRITRYGRMQYEPTPGNWTNITLTSPWTLGAIASLEDDGNLNDFIWQNPNTGTFSFWKVDTNANVTEYGPIKYEVSSGVWSNANMKSPWRISGVCEVDDDGLLNDIIWHNPQAGYVSRWDIGTNGYVNTFGKIKYLVGTNWVDVSMTSPWSMRGVVALNGDEKLNDVIWHHTSLGRFSCWRLTADGDDVHISDFGPFVLNGQILSLPSPWEISAARGY